ncbi:hypothetical protein LSTR_LSTR007510 [Laodelphax striatellus]|uniref:Uncharacterized protein n=1 Tax=Laodelphax striatellus TaxID=195883 RepID=A0A482X4B1_LAOST|nr:hypothetical protein LSTR_LSTR007510 [Laodelphax striatellus]
MKSQAESATNDITLIEILYEYVDEVLKFFNITSNTSVFYVGVGADWSSQSILEKLKDLVLWFSFDEFQLKLLKGFLAVLFATIIAIFFLWRVHGPRIHSRFMKPATTKVIEELRKSVAQLKLPNEHTPRI